VTEVARNPAAPNQISHRSDNRRRKAEQAPRGVTQRGSTTCGIEIGSSGARARVQMHLHPGGSHRLDGDEFTSSALVECWPLKVYTMWSGFLQIFLARERAGRKSGAVLPGPTPYRPGLLARPCQPRKQLLPTIARPNCLTLVRCGLRLSITAQDSKNQHEIRISGSRACGCLRCVCTIGWPHNRS
jgi:hypothetical protein